MKRTPKQKEANAIDRDLYRIIGRAEALPIGWQSMVKLRQVRSEVRRHMHPDDRKGTEG